MPQKLTTPRERYAELKRELEKRQELYPGWIRKKSIAENTANHRINCIAETMDDMEKLYPELKESVQTSLNFGD